LTLGGVEKLTIALDPGDDEKEDDKHGDEDDTIVIEEM